MRYAHDYRAATKRVRPTRGTGSRIFFVLLVGGLAAIAIGRSGVSTEKAISPAGPVKMARLSARSAQETAELNGIDGGAAAGMAFLAAKDKNNVFVVASVKPSRSIEATSSKVNIRDIRSSTAHTTKDKALADAVEQAKGEIAEALRSLDPPIQHVPTDETVKTDYLVTGRTQYLEASQEDQEAWKKAGLEPNRVWAKIDVEVSESQLRQLRGKDRLLGSAKWFGGSFLALLLGYGFLRLDAVTKGHLTFPLMAGLLASVIATVVAMFTLG